jgi:NADH dehydrogenase FAD-containing subunit
MHARPHVVVLGGGFAALEAVFLLRMRLHERVAIRLISNDD